MQIKIFTLKNGLEIFDNIAAIRITSKDYNLLILKDYVPIIGRIEGNIEIEFEEDSNQKKIENIVAYYVCHNNVFNLMIEGE